ncbi:MAG TPA: NADPH-dependent glutamate synthase [Candidatus Aminicenantes bacterium]|nr:MAG: glutamate synthase (NADPH), homotetrameric [Candidatus Aminicenantes bacterium]HEK85231.1 NADPH-dependent glutamate synthase [Candidatus Aminicenantes bacterium]
MTDFLEAEVKEKLREEREKDWRKALRRSISVQKRLEIPRQPMPAQPPAKRIKNFQEVNLGYTLKMAQEEARRCLDCGQPECVAGCPVAIDIPTFIKYIEVGELEKALSKIRETNGLPAICGRVCPQEIQCEKNCNLVKAGREPVAIGHLERFVADYFNQSEKPVRLEPRPEAGKKVAVIGAGPAGLTAAADLARFGYQVTIFEALHLPGGVLAYGIPEFRLPRQTLQAEINFIKSLGVEIKTNFIVGKTASLSDLQEAGFSAFFLGTGAGLPSFMNIPGENLVGIYSANEYLTRVNLMKAFCFPEFDTPAPSGKKVAVIGGGNVAMDAVRIAWRLGASEATIYYRRSRAEMPARAEEIKHAEEEGIIFNFLTVPVRFIGDEKRRLKAMVLQKLSLGEPDSSGRPRPVPIPNSEFQVEVDLVVMAIGQSPNPLLIKQIAGLKLGRWGNVEVNPETLASNLPGIYAGGDVVRGGATVILAMGDGRRAARAIDKYIRKC